MANKRDELMAIAKQALAEGDETTANAVMNDIEKLDSYESSMKGNTLQFANFDTGIPLAEGVSESLTNIGLGMSRVGRGVKRLAGFGYDKSTEESDRALEENSGVTGTVSRAVGGAAPFLPLGLASVGANALRNVGYQAAVGGLEGATVSAGKGDNAREITKSALLGSALGGGFQAASSYGGGILRALGQKYGINPSELVDQATGAPTQKALQIMQSEGISQEALMEPLKNADIAKAPAMKRADEIAATVELSPARVAAHDRAGIKAPIGAMTDDKGVQQISGALAAVPGSKAALTLEEYTDALTKHAEKLTEEAVGTLDSGAVSESLKIEMQDTIEKLKKDSGALYSQIDSLVPQNTIVNSKPILGDLQKRAANRQHGIEGLSAVERDAFNTLKGKPTYADVDALRKKIGDSIGSIKGHYTNEEGATLNRLYGQLSQLQEGAANQVGNGAGDLWKSAKELDRLRFKTQENSEFLFSEGLRGAASKKVEDAISMLAKRETKNFNKVMESIPDDYRDKVISSAIDNIMRKTYSGGEKQINAAGFTKFWGDLSSNPENKKLLTKHLPDGAVERLEDMNTMAQGLANINAHKTKTGIIHDSFKDFNQTDGIVGKLYGFSQKAQLAPNAVIRGMGVAADLATRAKTDAVQAADDMLASPEFRTAVLATDKGAKVAKIAEARLKKTQAYKNYMEQMRKTTNGEQAASSIASLGLIGWLTSGKDEDKKE